MTQAGITGAILAGGRARRMGGIDKGLVQLAGRPLIEHVLAAFSPQVDSVIINANRNQERYGAYGHPVAADRQADFQGPLAGMFSCLAQARDGLLATVPCDSPLPAPDLVARLYARLREERAELSVAHNGERLQPVFALMETALAPSLGEFLEGGGRKIDRWFAQHKLAVADFSDQPDSFRNINDPQDLERLEALLGG